MKLNGAVLNKNENSFGVGWFQTANLVLVEHFEYKTSEIRRISLWKELLVDLLETCFRQHSIRAISDEALIPLTDLFLGNYRIWNLAYMIATYNKSAWQVS